VIVSIDNEFNSIEGTDAWIIPTDLYELTDLDVLDITPEPKSGMNYRLTRVPIDLRLLTNLKCLHLDNNNLVSIPSEIGDLLQLETFTASHNFLTNLPNQMRKLQRLQSCHLAHNKFDQMPLSLCYLSKSLLFLDLSSNDLKQLPLSIQHLQALRTLLLLNNGLRALPDTICQLKNLETLWLGNNQLKYLPNDFTNLKHLDWYNHSQLSSNYEGNPLEHPPLAICRQGMNAIEQYLRKQ
jgi:leucine-rich repeat protein SHOC2